MVSVLITPELDVDVEPVLEDDCPVDDCPEEVEPVELELVELLDVEPWLRAKKAAPAATMITTIMIMTTAVVPTPGLLSR
jgi:hypothetical protein